MTVLSVTEAKKNLLALVREVQEQGKVYSLTRRGREAAVLLDGENYRSIVETLEVLSDPDELRGIMQGRKDIAAGRIASLEDLLERLRG